MGSSVAALLVSHDGERWLPAVISGLRAQRVPVQKVVAVDTGSRDSSPTLLEQAFSSVVRAPAQTSFPAAINLGLAELATAARGADAEWIWILHDDANPDPEALAALLTAAEADPEADILGPKLREWPSLKRLLELGVTISGTGRRETGLERGEYDQGQHDDVREVLAVNTAGMLVRRRVLEELGGFDPQLPIFGNDIDFGWRAASAGYKTLVVPQAVVFHAEAAHRGVRTTPLTGRHTHYQERRAALYTLLANCRTRALPFQVVRLALGTVLRMVGFLLVRAVGEALDELAALVSLYAHPRAVWGARRARRGRQVTHPAALRRLLAPPWVPYRHGLDFISDLASAATNQVQDVAERRRAAAALQPGYAGSSRPPLPEDEDSLGEETGLVVRFMTNPIAISVTVFLVLTLVGARAAFGSVAGGGLSPLPEGAGDWWRLHLESWHELGSGTGVPAPAYVLVLALAATVFFGSPGLTMSLLFLLAVPVALWGAWRFLRVIGRLVAPLGAPRWLLLWGAATYALVPVVSGAWGDGRFGTVAVAALLPWLGHAALGFADPEPARRWRAGWRVALLLAVTTAFTPVAWFFAVTLGLVAIAIAFLVVPRLVGDRSAWGPPATAVGMVPVLLAPWWLPLLTHAAAEGLLLDAGRLPAPDVDGWGLAWGRFADLGAPWWLGVPLVALAVLALAPRATRIPVLACWVVALVTGVLAAGLGTLGLDLAAATVSPGLSFLLVVLQGVLVVAALIGAQGVTRQMGSTAAAWRRGALLLAGVAAASIPLGGLIWFVAWNHDNLTDESQTGIPAYMVASSLTGPEHGILVISGNVDTGLTYTVRRGDGLTVGEHEILALSAEDADFTRNARALVARATPKVVDALADRGIEYVVLPAPADGDVAAVLDATSGLVQASAENRATRAWQVDRDLNPDAVAGTTSFLRIVLLFVQAVAVLVVAVLCAPPLIRRRDE